MIYACLNDSTDPTVTHQSKSIPYLLRRIPTLVHRMRPLDSDSVTDLLSSAPLLSQPPAPLMVLLCAVIVSLTLTH